MIESFWKAAAERVNAHHFGHAATVEQVAEQVFHLRDTNATLEVSVISENIVRLRVAPHGTFLPDFSYGRRAYPFSPCEPELTETTDEYHLRLPSFTLKLTKEGLRARFVTEPDHRALEAPPQPVARPRRSPLMLPDTPQADREQAALIGRKPIAPTGRAASPTATWALPVPPAHAPRADTDPGLLVLAADAEGAFWEENHDFGGYNVYHRRQIAPGECFYGLGDKASDLNLIGRRFTLWSTDAYAFEVGTDPLYRNIPFYIGLSQGVAYGIFFDNTYRSYFDFGADGSGQLTYMAEGGELCYYYIHGPHMLDVVKRYAHLTGTAPMPPLWALGYHQCRWSYYPEAKVRELAERFRAERIPCDALYLDIDYMDGYRCFTWDKDRFPDPAGLIGDLEQEGFRTVVILDPGIKVDPNYPVYTDGVEEGVFCRRGDDYYMEGPVWPGRCQFPDYTNPRARAWWSKWLGTLLETGVHGIWTDMNEPSVFGAGTFPMDVRHHYEGYGGSHRKAHNVYGMQMARATYEGLLEHRPRRRPFVITRSCYSGVQRYASCWTGDNIATWQHLYLAGVQCQRMSLSGISFVGSDIGGFTGSPDPELYVRWIQLGVFHPLMRAHSAGDTPEREPWSFGEPYTSICRKFIELRYRLLPYIYSAFWENHRYGFPILRPVVMLDQLEPSTTWRQDEFTFGDKILVCPVLEQGATSRTVYLPRGHWYYYGQEGLLEGGGEHVVDAPLDTMPIFIRAGSVIAEYPLMQYTGEIEIRQMTLTVYYSPTPANTFLYEDHGDTLAYEQDIYAEKHFSYVPDEGGHGYTLEQRMTGLYVPRYDTYNIRLAGLPSTDIRVEVDGREVACTTCPETRLPTIEVFKSFSKLRVTAAHQRVEG